MTNHATDDQLTARAKLGDRAALGDLLIRNQKRIYNIVLRMVGHRDDAAEVTQDALAKIIEHIADFKGQSAISTWMIRIAINLSYSLLRRRRIRHTASLDAAAHDDQITPLRNQLADTREPSPDSRVQQSEAATHLHTALQSLQDDLRAVLVLRDIDAMDYQQIAQVLDVPVGTVKSRLFRARLALRQELATRYPAYNDPNPAPTPPRPTPQPQPATPPKRAQ